MNFVAKAKSGVRGGNGLSAHRGLWADGPNLKPLPAVAVIAARPFREETFYSALVMVGGRKALSIEDLPSKQGVCLQVLEWSQRHGKSVVWNYL